MSPPSISRSLLDGAARRPRTYQARRGRRNGPVGEPRRRRTSSRSVPARLVERGAVGAGAADAGRKRPPEVVEVQVVGADDELSGVDLEQADPRPQLAQLVGVTETGSIEGARPHRPGTVDGDGGVPEGAQHRHPAREVPRAGRHDAPGRTTRRISATPRCGALIQGTTSCASAASKSPSRTAAPLRARRARPRRAPSERTCRRSPGRGRPPRPSPPPSPPPAPGPARRCRSRRRALAVRARLRDRDQRRRQLGAVAADVAVVGVGRRRTGVLTQQACSG